MAWFPRTVAHWLNMVNGSMRCRRISDSTSRACLNSSKRICPQTLLFRPEKLDAATLNQPQTTTKEPRQLQRNTMNHFHYDKGELFCEQRRVAELAEEFGTPCWIYSKAALLGRLKEIQTAFAVV